MLNPSNKPTPHQHPLPLWALKFLLFFLGISALFPGISLMVDPTGKGIQFPEGSLEGSPFYNYFIPGILLTIFIGLLPLMAWYVLWKKPESPFLEGINPFRNLYWGWTAALISGMGLVIWILVQMTMVPYFFLQPTLLVWGIAIMALCLLPGTRAYYKK